MPTTSTHGASRPWWKLELGPIFLGIAGALLTFLAAGAAYTVASRGLVVQPLAVLPLTLAALAGGVVHGYVYGWSRNRPVWGLPIYVMLAGWFAGLAGGAIIATYSFVLVPSLLGFPDLNRTILDLQPPFTTPLITMVTLWALVGIGAVVGGLVGLLSATAALPVLFPLWWMARAGRWLLRPRVDLAAQAGVEQTV